MLPGAVFQVAQGKGRDIVKGLAGSLAERGVLVGDSNPVKLLFHGKDPFLARLQKRIETADDRHGQDHVTVLAAHINIAQHVVGNTPDKIHNVVVDDMVHSPLLLLALLVSFRRRIRYEGREARYGNPNQLLLHFKPS